MAERVDHPGKMSKPRGSCGPRVYLSVVSIAAWVVLTALYALRPAGVDPITIWPFWFWSLPAMALSLFGISCRNRQWGVVGAALWLLVTPLIAEEPAMLLRSLTRPEAWSPHQTGTDGACVRVITLNCAGGNPDAAIEALSYCPDIVLLQEAPGVNELRKVLAACPGWMMASSQDPAILARGSVRPLDVPLGERGTVCASVITLAGIKPPTELMTLSTRLTLPELAYEFWHPITWLKAAHARAAREQQMAIVARYARAWTRQSPTIVGGDFNAPAGDSLYAPLRGCLRDAFAEGGSGWPNTIINETPFSRIDQVWISDHFRVKGGRAVRTGSSDHRMVIVDLALQGGPAKEEH